MKFKLFTYLFVFVFSVGFPTLGFSNESQSQSIEKNQSTVDEINHLMEKTWFLLGAGAFGGFNLGLGAAYLGLETANSVAPYLGIVLPHVEPSLFYTIGATVGLSAGAIGCYLAFKE